MVTRIGWMDSFFFLILILLPLLTFTHCAARGLQEGASRSISGPTDGGFVLGFNSSHVFLTSGSKVYAVLAASPYTAVLRFEEPDLDEISGGFYDQDSASIYLCTNLTRRVYRVDENNSTAIRQFSDTTSLSWRGCAYDSINDVMFVAGEQEIGAIPNLKSQPNSASWFSTNLGGTVSQVRTVVFGGGRVFFGGASGSIFVTPTSNRELLSGQIRTYTRGMGNIRSLAFGSSRNRLFIGSDQGILTEVITSTMIVSRSFNATTSPTAQIRSILIDSAADTLFINVVITDASKIIRLNLNEAELSSFSELLLTNAVLASGLVDPREGQYQMFFVSAAGDQLHVIKTTDCSVYLCDECHFDRNYCGFCTQEYSCTTKYQCAKDFVIASYSCPTSFLQVSPTSAPIGGGTNVTITGNFVDVNGDQMTEGVVCRWSGADAATTEATVVSRTAIRCATPPFSLPGSYFLSVEYNGVAWGLTIFPFTSCDQFDDINTCVNKPNCGFCTANTRCTTLSGCSDASSWTSKLPVANVFPTSAPITGTIQLAFFSDVKIPSGLVELMYNDFGNPTTQCSKINSNNLACPVPVVSQSMWDSTRGTNLRLTTRLILMVNARSFATYENFTVYDCPTFGQDCASCTAIQNGECAFCFDTMQCGYNKTCNAAGQCASLASMAPESIYTGDIVGQTITLTGTFVGLDAVPLACGFNSQSTLGVASVATFVSDHTITCTLPALFFPGPHIVFLWRTSPANSILAPGLDFTVYDCTGYSCNDCLSPNRPACRFCQSSASCIHRSAACASPAVSSSACPNVTTVLPSSMAVFERTTISVKGSFPLALVSGPVVACRWSFKSAPVISTPAVSVTQDSLSCEEVTRNSAAVSAFSVSINNGTIPWTNEVPFIYYSCESIVGDCSTCITSATPSCKWCGDSCAYTCSDSEREMTTCPSLTSIEPDHSHIDGNELITIVGGPFLLASGFNYECRFGSRRALATVINSNAIRCFSPPVLSATKVNVTVWLNNKNYAPFTSLSFTYFSCNPTSEAVCTSSCSSQQYCGWCSSRSACTASHLCNAIDDMFLPQCLGVSLDPPFLAVGASQDVTVKVSPSLPEFFVLSAFSSKKRATSQISPDQLVTCSLSNGQTTNGVIKSSNEILCAVSAPASVSSTTLTVKYNNASLFEPVTFTFIDCSTATACSDCINVAFCGWCSSTGKCTTESSCSDSWAKDSCPNDQQVTPGADPAVVVPAVIIPIVVVAAGLTVLLLWLRKRRRMQRVEDGTEMTQKKQAVSIMNSISSIDEKLRIPSKTLELKKELGAGSFGKVFLGEWQGAKVAIKVCASVANVDGFFEEAALTVGLPPHPNVVQTFGISVDGPLPYIVLEFCGGGSLDTKLFDDGVSFSLEEKVRLIKGIARGLLHLHNHNIVHRDLAARNILLTVNNEPKISDFGMSRLLKEESQKGQTKNNFGPIRWMAPESIRDLSYSTKSDVWSFGIIVYEIMAGREPHSDIADIIEIAMKIKTENMHPALPANIDQNLASLMLSCWRPAAADRPSMAEVVQKLSSAFPNQDN